MGYSNNRREQPGKYSSEFLALLLGLIFLVSIVLTVWLSVRLGYAHAEIPQPPGGPFDVFFDVISGNIPWPLSSTVVCLSIVAMLVILLCLLLGIMTRTSKVTSRVDHAARYLGRGKDVAPLTRSAVAATSRRFGVTGSLGVPIGKIVGNGTPLWGSWEDMHIDIWGPRTGKTTSRAIPAILDAPGAVLVTSNKRDIVDATRGPRQAKGPVWVFDPQSVAAESPNTWWWDPLSYVTDEVRAAKLADHFASGSRDPGARTDAFFDSSGRDLLAGLILAAAIAGEPITQVYRWLTDPLNTDPVTILKKTPYSLIADQVAGVIYAPEKQRGGIYGTAMQMASCLTSREAVQWVTPRSHSDSRKQFSPRDFVRSGGTLFSLSSEGQKTAGPLVTALTVAVVEAAEDLAVQSAGGRLPVPLLGVLDEAANVCRWRDLPNQYSHYGSRGIILMTILQSWSQGVEVWGRAGMAKLWSASNVAVYGGGVKEKEFLDMVSALIGDFDKQVRSVSTGRGQRNVTEQLTRERILDSADLQALPKGRAIVLGSGCRPAMVETQPWMSGAHADQVRASIKKFEPAGNSSRSTPTTVEMPSSGFITDSRREK